MGWAGHKGCGSRQVLYAWGNKQAFRAPGVAAWGRRTMEAVACAFIAHAGMDIQSGLSPWQRGVAQQAWGCLRACRR